MICRRCKTDKHVDAFPDPANKRLKPENLWVCRNCRKIQKTEEDKERFRKRKERLKC